jgi:hypothetical protein
MHAIHIVNIAGVYVATVKSAHPNQGGYLASGLCYRDTLVKIIRTMHAHGEHTGITL